MESSLGLPAETLDLYRGDFEREQVDWRVILDLHDLTFEAEQYLHRLIHLADHLKLETQNAITSGESSKALKNIELMHRLAVHFSSSQNGIGTELAEEVSRLSLQSISLGIVEDVWSPEQTTTLIQSLEKIRLTKRFSVRLQLEVSLFFQNFGSPGVLRRSMIENDTEVHIVRLPFNLIKLNIQKMEKFENWVNRAIVQLAPPGWFQQSLAQYLVNATNFETKAPVPSARHEWIFNSLGINFHESFLQANRADVKVELLIAALQAHQLRSEDRSFPELVALPSPQYGYCLDLAERPVIWYSESGFAGKTPQDLKFIQPDYIWQFP